MLNLLLSGLLIQNPHRPPTDDPTYGFPVPQITPAVPVGKPDAKWIWTAQTHDNQTIYIERAFNISSPPASAALYVTADDFFTAFVNGHEVGETAPDPGNGNVWATVHRYGVSSLLHVGANLITIRARNAGGLAGVLARLEVDGKPTLLSGPDWRVSESEPTADWTSRPATAGWLPATVIGPAGSDPWGSQLEGWPTELQTVPGYLRHLMIRPIRWAFAGPDVDRLTWQPIGHPHYFASRTGGGPAKLLLDFGKELSGRVDASRAAWPAGESVAIGTGESVGEAIEKPYTQATLSADRRYGPYTAFRYVAITLPRGLITFPEAIVADHLYYPVKYAGRFDCSDPLLTKIWYTGAYTAHLCMLQDIWDAPKRDRARWMGDLHVSGEVIDDVFLDRYLMEQTMERLRKEAQGSNPEPHLPHQHVNGIPGYSCAWIAGLADFYRHTGDFAYLRSQHDALVSMLVYMRGEFSPEGIFANRYGEWPFVDWAPEFNRDTPAARAATHFFFIAAVREAVFLLRALGDEANAGVNAAWADLLTLAAQVKLMGKDGTFGDRRQENAMAIYSGAVTPVQRDAIYDRIFRPGSPAWNWQATPYYNNYVIYAMSMAGHTADAMDFVRRYWGGMIAEGATTFWEGYDPSWDKHNSHIHLRADDGEGYFVSLCHGWSAGATSWLTDRVLGVRSTGPGFATCEIQPELGNLDWVEGTVPTPHGPIDVHVDRTGNRLRARVHVPAGVEATVRLSGRPPVTVSGGNVILRS